jgi:hypothetical protein
MHRSDLKKTADKQTTTQTQVNSIDKDLYGVECATWISVSKREVLSLANACACSRGGPEWYIRESEAGDGELHLISTHSVTSTVEACNNIVTIPSTKMLFSQHLIEPSQCTLSRRAVEPPVELPESSTTGAPASIVCLSELFIRPVVDITGMLQASNPETGQGSSCLPCWSKA